MFSHRNSEGSKINKNITTKQYGMLIGPNIDKLLEKYTLIRMTWKAHIKTNQHSKLLFYLPTLSFFSF
jgi:hypothetical protein